MTVLLDVSVSFTKSVLAILTIYYFGVTQGGKTVDASVFGFPLLFPYKNCNALPTPQSLGFHFTNLLTHSADIVAFQLGSTSKTENRFQGSVQELQTFWMIEPNSIAKYNETCQRYYCDEKPTREELKQSNTTCRESEMITGFYIFINAPAILLTVNQKGPDFTHIYSALPTRVIQSKQPSEFEYHILQAGSRVNHTNGIAIMATLNCTNITITPSIDLYLYTIHKRKRISIITVHANETSTITCLYGNKILWLEEVATSCLYSNTNTSETFITASLEIAVYRAEVQCNDTQVWDNETKPFSFLAHTVQQIPPIDKWGKKFIADLSHLKSLQLSKEGTVAVFHIQTSNITTNVHVVAYKREEVVTNIQKNVLVGKPLQVEFADDEQRDITNVIIHSTHPVFVLYEAHSATQESREILFTTIVQPVEWYTYKQSVLLSRSLIPQSERYHIALFTLNNNYKPNTVLVSDQEHYLKPVTVEHYGYFEHYTTYNIEEYTVFQIYVNSSIFNTSDKTLVFNYSSSHPCGKLGATVFAYGQRNGYAYSNGYVSDDSTLIEGVSCRKQLKLNIYAIIIGTIVALVTVVIIAVTCVILRFCCIPRIIQPEPPVNDFEFDVFLSFAEEDKDFVTKYLYDPLKRNGYLVFWHHSDFIPGLTINENILRAIQTSRRIIFVCSEHFHQSDFCQKELKFGVDSHYNKYKGKYRRVVPVVIQEGQCPQELRQLRPIKVDKNRLSKAGDQQVVKKLKFGKSIENCKKKAARKRKWWLKGQTNTTNDEETISFLSDVSDDHFEL